MLDPERPIREADKLLRRGECPLSANRVISHRKKAAGFLVVSDEPPLWHSIPGVCTVYNIISESGGLMQREQATAAPTKAPLNSINTDRCLVR